SQVTLLAASPLWNGHPAFVNFKNHDGTALAPLQYSSSKWRDAADAAKAVIDLSGTNYKLFTNLDEGDATFDPYLSVRNVFLTNWNNEIIFSTNMAGTWQWGLEKRAAPGPGGYNMENATQNIVDAYYTRDGKDIDDETTYTEIGFAGSDDPEEYGKSRDGVNRVYITGNSNMYVNREPRFYAHIQYNGKPVLPAPTSDDRNFFSSAANQDGRGRAEFYYAGKSGVGVNNNG